MTGKVLTDYTSETKEIQACKFETLREKELYSRRMPIVEHALYTTNIT